jgi:hypothetical protein
VKCHTAPRSGLFVATSMGVRSDPSILIAGVDGLQYRGAIFGVAGGEQRSPQLQNLNLFIDAKATRVN